MNIKHIVKKIKSEDTLLFNHVTDLLMTNYGTSNATVNGMQIPSGQSRHLMSNVIADDFSISIEFDSKNQIDNMLEISYLTITKTAQNDCVNEIAIK